VRCSFAVTLMRSGHVELARRGSAVSSQFPAGRRIHPSLADTDPRIHIARRYMGLKQPRLLATRAHKLVFTAVCPCTHAACRYMGLKKPSPTHTCSVYNHLPLLPGRYMGLKQPRLRGDAYYEIVDEFVQVSHRGLICGC